MSAYKLVNLLISFLSHYYRGGYISGECSAGYFCLSGSDEYTPDTAPPTADPLSYPCVPNTRCAGPCPAGSYCPLGTKDPIPCPEHTLRNETGARMFNDCVPCSAGSWCHEGKHRQPDHWMYLNRKFISNVGISCTTLNIWDFGNLEGSIPSKWFNKFWAPESPIRFFSNLLIGDCVFIPGDPVAAPCPMGNYCPTGVGPIKCPRLHFRNQFGGSNITDCVACPAGYWCNVTGRFP